VAAGILPAEIPGRRHGFSGQIGAAAGGRLAYSPGMSGRDASSGRPDAERILVVCTRYIGDTVLAIPFLRNLRRAYPHARIDVCAEGGARAVLADCPYVDELVAWRRPAGRRSIARSLAAIRTQAAWLRSRGYDRAYLLKRSLSGALLASLAGIPHRVGFAADGRMLLTTAIAPSRGRHQAARYLDLLRADELPVDDGRNENWITPAAAARAATLLAPLPAGRSKVFLAVRSTAKEKHWPLDRWAMLVTRLVHERHAEVVLCGAPDDLPTHDALRQAVGPAVAAHVHDLTAEISLRDTGALMARMDLCIGVDTGLVHLAASHDVPVVVLFGPTDPNRWSPWTPRATVVRSARIRRSLAERLGLVRRHGVHAWPFGTASLDDIPVSDVLESAAAFLAEPVPPAIRTLDLRTGGFRYEVLVGSAAAAAEPATKPLAQAH
jgi:heptosyltransferase-2